MTSRIVIGAVIVAASLFHARPSSAQTCRFASTSSLAAGPDETALVKNVAEAKTDAALSKARAALTDYWLGGVSLHAVTVTARERVTVTLANPPSSRLRLNFDSSTGGHHEVEWDPAVASELTRTIALEGPTSGSMRVWNITASVEAATYTQSAGTVVIHTRFGGFAPGTTTSGTLIGTYSALIASVAASPESKDLRGWPAPALSFSCGAALGAMSEETFPAAGGTQTTGLRGFGVAPTFVTDTLSLLTEIAVDRARSGAMNVLKKRLVDPFCVDTSKISLARLHLGVSDELALPRTCGVLTSLRLEDILSSGRPLLFALRDDLRFTIAPAAIAQLTPGNGPAKTALGVGLSILNTAVDHGGFDGLEGQLALDLLGSFEQLAPRFTKVVTAKLQTAVASVFDTAPAQDLLDAITAIGANAPPCKALVAFKADLGNAGVAAAVSTCVADFKSWFAQILANPSGKWTLASHTLLAAAQAKLVEQVRADATTKTAIEYACQARLIVAVVKRCSKDGCSASNVVDMLSKPADYFAPDTALPAALCWSGTTYIAPEGEAAAVADLVLEGLRLVAPLVDGRGRDRAKSAVKLIVKLVQRWQSAPGGHSCKCLDTFSEMAVALIDEDYGTALGRLVRLAEQVQPARIPTELQKLAQLVGAVATYASVYQATKDDDPKAARTARKQALSSIIDDATDRSHWDGARLYSLGSNVGLSLTWDDRYGSKEGDDVFDPGLRVPLGIGVDWMHHKDSAFGLHVGLQVADLGQFVRRGTDDKLDDVRWADFVSPGAEVGVLLAFLDPRLNLALHLAYAPSLEYQDQAGEHTDGVWRYGLSLSYYVPFFDLN